MIENRLTRRYRMSDAFCALADKQEDQRKVFNVSMGGMLIERIPSDELQVNDTRRVVVRIANQEEFLTVKVVRVQENSFGVVFPKLDEEEASFLYKTLRNFH